VLPFNWARATIAERAPDQVHHWSGALSIAWANAISVQSPKRSHKRSNDDHHHNPAPELGGPPTSPSPVHTRVLSVSRSPSDSGCDGFPAWGSSGS